ncbi:MAG TPA: hypothetical protein VI461_09065 [Chitinophagaceae bacterium]|nr:hypothetical protein [Chitinophagaceae bacterium]
MKKIIICGTVCFLFVMHVYAQDTAIIREINEQVWKPFMMSFSNGDGEKFKSVHSKDVIRVTQDDRKILGYDQYFPKTSDTVKAKWGNWKKSIELRFIQRITGNDKAFEVGYYKTTSTNMQTGEIRKGIGKFHVLLRKESGAWKILMDADTGEGANEDVFNKALPLE